MIALDSGILLRLLADDERMQCQEALGLLRELEARREPAWVSVTTLCEVVWGLSRAYRVPRPRIVEVLRKLLDTGIIVLEDDDAVREAVAGYEQGRGDFADHLLSARARRGGCRVVVSFDEPLVPGVEGSARPLRALTGQRRAPNKPGKR